MSNTNRTSVTSGTKWEKLAGYARAVRVGNHIWVSGTTATDGEGTLIGKDDPAAQTRFVLGKIERALQQLGASLNDVVRTRVYVSDIAHSEPVARVNGEVFADIQPANTLVESKLVGSGYLVEVEAEAVLSS